MVTAVSLVALIIFSVRILAQKGGEYLMILKVRVRECFRVITGDAGKGRALVFIQRGYAML